VCPGRPKDAGQALSTTAPTRFVGCRGRADGCEDVGVGVAVGRG
jgi:hypothetical protein